MAIATTILRKAIENKSIHLLEEAGAEADSLYSWIYREDPLWSPRWELIRANFNQLRGNRRIDTLTPLPPWGAVPGQPPLCVPPEPCPPR